MTSKHPSRPTARAPMHFAEPAVPGNGRGAHGRAGGSDSVQDASGLARVVPVQRVQEPSVRQVRIGLILIWLCGLVLLAVVIALSWNSKPYWMDAEEYALSVAQGRWVVHPPGHIFFVATARLFYALGVANPYIALQMLTLSSTLGGMLLLYWLLREVVGSLQSSLLVFAFALSWVPLLINHTGTSSTSDFFTTPLLLWSATRLTTRPTRSAAAMLGLAVFLCGGFRLTTLFMMVPLLVTVLWVNRRNPYVWIACAVSGLMVGLLQLLVIRVSGGWNLYSFMVWKQNFFRTYNLIDDFARPALFNMGRSLIWFGLGTLVLPFALLRLRSPRPWNANQRVILVYGALATAGPMAVCTLYLCEHPGYVAPALAGFYLCVAVAWNRAGSRLDFAKWPIAASIASLLLFFSTHYYRTPTTRGQAIANYLLLQYSADGARHACYKTTSDWLRAAKDMQLNPSNADQALER